MSRFVDVGVCGDFHEIKHVSEQRFNLWWAKVDESEDRGGVCVVAVSLYEQARNDTDRADYRRHFGPNVPLFIERVEGPRSTRPNTLLDQSSLHLNASAQS